MEVYEDIFVCLFFFFCIFTMYRVQLDKRNELPHATSNSVN